MLFQISLHPLYSDFIQFDTLLPIEPHQPRPSELCLRLHGAASWGALVPFLARKGTMPSGHMI